MKIYVQVDKEAAACTEVLILHLISFIHAYPKSVDGSNFGAFCHNILLYLWYQSWISLQQENDHIH